jgi:hypothetical protein
MDEKMPVIGGFVSSSGTIQPCTKADPAKKGVPIYFYTPAKDDVYPKTRTGKLITEYRAAGFKNFKNISVEGAKHGSDKCVKFHKLEEFTKTLKERNERPMLPAAAEPVAQPAAEPAAEPVAPPAASDSMP